MVIFHRNYFAFVILSMALSFSSLRADEIEAVSIRHLTSEEQRFGILLNAVANFSQEGYVFYGGGPGGYVVRSKLDGVMLSISLSTRLGNKTLKINLATRGIIFENQPVQFPPTTSSAERGSPWYGQIVRQFAEGFAPTVGDEDLTEQKALGQIEAMLLALMNLS